MYAAVALLILLVSSTVLVAADDDQRQCLSLDQVDEKMGRTRDKARAGTGYTYDRPKRALTSLRIPGTASSKLYGDVDYSGQKTRYPVGTWQTKCNALCFDNSMNDDELGSDLPFVEFTGGLQGSHIPYDTIIDRVGKDGIVLDMITTIRDPYQYARKMWLSREAFDGNAVNFHNLTFGEWLKKATWRSNQMTRWLGRVDQDENIWPGNNMVKSPSNYETYSDNYMKEQNALGSKSEVLERAWKRLQDMVWFGIFDRLRESYDLLAFTFCRDENTWNDKKFYEEEKNVATGFDLLKFMRDDRKGGLDSRTPDKELEELEKLITERNQLDKILLERANKLLDDRLAEMKAMKERGILCFFLRRVEVSCEGAAPLPERAGVEDNGTRNGGIGEVKARGYYRVLNDEL